jgi:hypothetical protein
MILIIILVDLQAQEDTQYSVMAKVELRKLFGKRIVSDVSHSHSPCFSALTEIVSVK